MTEQWYQTAQLQTPPLQKNLHLFSITNPQLLEQLQQNLNHEPLLFQQQGQCIRCRTAGEPVVWLFGASNPVLEQQQLMQRLREIDVQAKLIVMAGCAAGYAFAGLQPLLRRDQSKRVLIIEPSEARLWALLALVDVSQELQKGQLFFAVGNADEAGVTQAITDQGLIESTQVTVFISPETQTELTQESLRRCYQTSQEEYRDTRTQQLGSLSHYQRSQTIKRVLLIDCWQNAPGSIHLQTIGHFLEKRGVQVQSINLNRYLFDWWENYQQQTEMKLIPMLDEFAPDLILSYGYHAPRFVSKELFDSYGAHWVQVVTNVAYFDESQYAGEHTVLLDEHLIPYFEKRGYENLHFIPLMADYVAAQPTPTNRSLPVLFVGNSLGLPPASVQKFFTQWQGRTDLMQYIRDAEAVLGDFDQQDNLYEYITRNPIPQIETVKEEYEVFRYLLCQGSAARRKVVLEKLVPVGLVLYGGDWDGYLPQDSVLRNCLRGALPLHEEQKSFEQGGVFINIHSVGHVTGPNMRFFNVAGMGGFQLSDGALFERYLSPDKETVYAHSVEEYVEKTHYYLAHPEEMDGIRQQAWETVKSQWTYDHWLDELASKLGIPFSG